MFYQLSVDEQDRSRLKRINIGWRRNHMVTFFCLAFGLLKTKGGKRLKKIFLDFVLRGIDHKEILF